MATDSSPFPPPFVPDPGPMTFDEFMAWDPEFGRSEWVDGRGIWIPSSMADHQRLLGFVACLISGFTDVERLGQVLIPPFVMWLPQTPSAREPDILYIAAHHMDRLRETHLDGPADLVVEIVSPDSQARDFVDKLNEYEAAKIPEYWVIDWMRQNAFFFLLGEDGRYHLTTADQDGIYHSRVLTGFALRVEWLWQRPLPTAEQAIREMEGFTHA
jgi:Uma2 family endonuclease